MGKKSYEHLDAAEREEISLGLARGESRRDIAHRLGRAPSTISRELKRNGAEPAGYRGEAAEHQALARAHRPRRPRTLTDPWLMRYVLTRLRRGWSPEQIAGRLKRDYPDDMRKRVCHETIYVALYVLPRGALRRELLASLRQARQRRRPRRRGADRRGQIPNMVSIHDRPTEVETRRVPGHWEGDLLKGAANRSAIGTLVERRSRLTLLVKLDDSSASAVRLAFERRFNRLPRRRRASLTYDRGKEMAEHERLSAGTKVRVYFCDPHSPWQRGTNENTNGLLRQYLPKGTNLGKVSARELRGVAHRLNTRPRKCLDWATPLEVFQQSSRVALGS